MVGANKFNIACGGVTIFFIATELVIWLGWYLPFQNEHVFDKCIFQYCLANETDQYGSVTKTWYRLEYLDIVVEYTIPDMKEHQDCAWYRNSMHNDLRCCYLKADVYKMQQTGLIESSQHFVLDGENPIIGPIVVSILLTIVCCGLSFSIYLQKMHKWDIDENPALLGHD